MVLVVGGVPFDIYHARLLQRPWADLLARSEPPLRSRNIYVVSGVAFGYESLGFTGVQAGGFFQTLK